MKTVLKVRRAVHFPVSASLLYTAMFYNVYIYRSAVILW